MDINIRNDPRIIIVIRGVSGEGDPVWMIGSSYDYFAFLTHRTWNGVYNQPWGFLDEYNVVIFADFQQCISEVFVFLNILRKYSLKFLKIMIVHYSQLSKSICF